MYHCNIVAIRKVHFSSTVDIGANFQAVKYQRWQKDQKGLGSVGFWHFWCGSLFIAIKEASSLGQSLPRNTGSCSRNRSPSPLMSETGHFWHIHLGKSQVIWLIITYKKNHQWGSDNLLGMNTPFLSGFEQLSLTESSTSIYVYLFLILSSHVLKFHTKLYVYIFKWLFWFKLKNIHMYTI